MIRCLNYIVKEHSSAAFRLRRPLYLIKVFINSNLLCFALVSMEMKNPLKVSSVTIHGMAWLAKKLYFIQTPFSLSYRITCLWLNFMLTAWGMRHPQSAWFFFRENYVCQITSHEFAVMYLKKNDTAKVRHSFTHDSCAGRGDSLR